MTPNQILLFSVVFLVMLLAVHAAWRRKLIQPVHEHQWRSITAPFAWQCRECGVTIFQEDVSGNFPDGLREYFAYMKTYESNPVPRREDICHCGASMVKDGDIWLCEICGSWRRPNV